MHWITAPPVAHECKFTSTLTPFDLKLAFGIANSVRSRHRVNVVQMSPSTLNNREIGVVANLIPEIAKYYESLSNHQMKTSAFVADDVRYQTPVRDGDIIIKPAGWNWEKAHIAFGNSYERAKFALYGSTTLAVVVKHDGVLQGMENLMFGLAAALTAERVESVIVVTDGITPANEWKVAFDLFGCQGITLGYHKLEDKDL